MLFGRCFKGYQEKKNIALNVRQILGVHKEDREKSKCHNFPWLFCVWVLGSLVKNIIVHTRRAGD